jgi:hypothetical protein
VLPQLRRRTIMRLDPQPLPRYYYLLIVEPGPCWTRLLFDQIKCFYCMILYLCMYWH